MITPTMPRAPMPLVRLDPAEDLASLIPYTCPLNLTGQSAITVPCGVAPGEVPIGLQIVGRPYQENGLITIAAAFANATEWERRVPPIVRGSPTEEALG